MKKEIWFADFLFLNISCVFKLLNLYIDGNIVIAEWDASFYSNIENARIHIREVAIIETENEKIKYLREYWQSERLK